MPTKGFVIHCPGLFELVTTFTLLGMCNRLSSEASLYNGTLRRVKNHAGVCSKLFLKGAYVL